MYHELILALGGFTGDVFKYDGFQISISKDLEIPLMHQLELAVIEEILEIASLYKKLELFVTAQNDIGVQLGMKTSKLKAQSPCGLYVTAVANGIQQILDRYLDVVADLETQILENPYMTLTGIRGTLESFRSIFRSLVSLTKKIQTQSKSSGLIVEIVKGEYDLNIPIQDELRILVPWVNKVMYKQIINWLVFGALFDPKGEFFIQAKKGDDMVNSTKAITASEKAQNKYIVEYSIVPSHLPVTLTERILFIGYAIGILSNSEKTKASLISKQKEFFDKLNKLSVNSFRVEELDETVEELASAVGKDLHYLVVTETDLPKHLGIVKDFYLTGRGELFHDFLLNLKTIPYTKNTLLPDVRQAFVLSASRVQVQEEILQRLQITINQDKSVTALESLLSKMSLGIEDEWPLHVLFTPESVNKYNELFRFLIQVRRLQMDLNQLWLNTRKIFRFPVQKGPAELRNIMSYFIDHLQHYLQEDVLETQYCILMSTIEQSDNFEQIRIAHALFQSNIMNQSFRSSTRLQRFVEETVKVCNDFVSFINKHLDHCDATNSPINDGISQEVLGFHQDFKRHMDLLLNLLKGMASNPQSGQFLRQFLLRLDFNLYFSSIISGFNT